MWWPLWGRFLKKNPGFLACQLKTRVYSHKVLLCSRENTEKISSRAKTGRQKTATLNVNNPSDDIAECEIDNMEFEIEESEEERLRRRIKELELSLERETARRKSVKPSAISFHKAVLGGNMNSSRMAAALPPSTPSFRRFLAMFSQLSGSMRSLSRPPSI